MKKFAPARLVLLYHYLEAKAATILYGFPSRKIIIIGVTGTKGKTSTINFIWSTLSAGGNTVGIISTANIRIGEKEFLNKYHMTMPGPFVVQKLIAQMVKAGCNYCIVETTSEGIKQSRHIGIYYDIGVFTNLTPEHLQSHGGSFEKYKATKNKMFEAISNHRKIIKGKEIEKVIITNSDSEHAGYFARSTADKKISFSTHSPSDYRAEQIKETPQGVEFIVSGTKFNLSIFGTFNVHNALPAIIIARLAEVSNTLISKGLASLSSIPGRMEVIHEGQPFTVIVDYAHERESITEVLKTARNMKVPGAKTIILLGAEGGGRDTAKRPIMGELGATMAEYLIITNVDPYEDDPQEILEDIARSAQNFGKIRESNLFVIEDRRAGIAKALSLAQPNDIVLITGKGAEQSIVIGGRSVPWDDRVIVREEIKKIKEEK
jgi:UDP-N-acetylmuramoyl-L-alanyl-D-glutamate--2,6-diaminopimelate ligase